jgi:hypothetical protein
MSGKTKKPRVLIGFAEALAGPEVAWSLADAGFEVWSFARKGRRSALRHSRYVRVVEVTPPEVSVSACFEELCSVAQPAVAGNLQAPLVVLPLDDTAVWLCAHRSLPQGWLLAGPRRDTARLALDKEYQTQAARAAGLQVPNTRVVSSPDEALRGANSFPLILKPAEAVCFRQGAVHKGRNWICADQKELEKAVDSWGGKWKLLVQPFLCGIGEGIFGLATAEGVDRWSGHRRLRMMNPHGSGSSACVSQPVPETLKAPVARLVKQAGWRGLFMVELLCDRSDQHWFVEFNGRAWGSMALSRRQGLEYPAWTTNLALDPQWRLPEDGHRTPEVVCRNLGREIMHLAFALRGRKSAAIRQWPSFWRSAGAMLRIGRRDSLYNFRRDDLGVFLSDVYCTIRDQLIKERTGPKPHAK